MEPARTAFVSYASEDEAIASTISAYLEQCGVPCWIASRDVRPGADYASEIITGIERSAVLVLVLSEHANTSEFVKREVERAVSKGRPVFPVRVREVAPSKSLELFISSAEWIDAWQPPIEQHLGRLADTIRSAATPAASLPPPQVSVTSAARSGGSQRTLILALGAAVLVLTALLAWSVLGRRSAPGAPPPAAGSGATEPAATTASESTPPAGVRGPCPRTLSVNSELQTPFTCTCSAEAAGEGAVWGTDFYTDDSGLCRAALHAGVISPQGGVITVNRTSARPLYVGTTRNGVRSEDFPTYPRSIEFKGTKPVPPGPGPCPRSLSVSRELQVPFTCRCDDESTAIGAVWGTDVYTDDSSICRAAVHAGRISLAGGPVTVTRGDGRPLYVGSTRNGVRSNDFGQYPVSISFP